MVQTNAKWKQCGDEQLVTNETWIIAIGPGTTTNRL